MSEAAWTSTKALSVYNVLVKANRSLTPDEIAAWLQQNWRASIDGEYVALGVGYLIAKGFVVQANGAISAAVPGRRLQRVNGDIDLAWV